MDPATDEVDHGTLHEEEQKHAADTDEDREGRHADEDGRDIEGEREDTGVLVKASMAVQILSGLRQCAVLVETEVSRRRAVVSVSDPLWLEEDDDVEDCEADREDGPHDSDGTRIAHIVCVVDAAGLCQLVDLHCDCSVET